MTSDIGSALLNSFREGFSSAAQFIPNVIMGIIILLIGLILGAIVKGIVKEAFRILKVDSYLRKYGIPEAKREFTWTNLLAEIARWFVIILFLIPAADIWNLPQITTLLEKFLLYLPNVFVATVIAIVGLVFAKLAYDVVLASTQEVSPDISRTIASASRWAIIIFVILAVLNQLGVAQDLIKILFTGFVAMIAIAGGIAFGLGGQDTAKSLLESLRKGLQNPPKK